ncbi:G patch domain-containing protein 4 [Cylas formicarius]|uniref:G patch domain-containing protein 4 n=1 Tax=Cylas formicarius TaxID=197179 RepID=UPI00295839B8|nr:G patch domain-containing protein 4 [Cylas formicarius]
MSMLAERRRKQKWSLNPRGKDWAQDTNKFGQKMLEKMGWTSGKGLGAKENGITEHVKVAYKNDSQGMGYKETNDQWTAHEANFSALLESLCGKRVEEVQLSSLEEKSQKSRARVHYKKFTRGKDLSRYSEKDLANIFGKKSLKELRKPSKEVEEVTDNKQVEEKSSFLLNSGLMSDYFKKKLPNFGSFNGNIVGNNGVLQKQQSESESEVRPNGELDLNDKQQKFISYIDESKVSKARKHKKRKLNSDTNDMADKELKETHGKKKKKSKSNIPEGVNNPAFDPMYNMPIKLEKHSLDPIEEILDDTLPLEPEHLEVNVQIHDEEGRVTRKQAASLQGKEKEKIEESTLRADSGIQNLDLLDSKGECEVVGKKKKKKHKDKGVENPVFQIVSGEEDELMQLDNPFEVKSEGKNKKKRKRTTEIKSEYGLDNPVFSEDPNLNNDLMNQQYEVKRKKSKKEKGLDNPALNLSDSIDDSCDLVLNIVSTPVTVKQTELSFAESLNTQKTTQVTRRKSVRFSDVTRERIIPTKEQLKLMEDDSVEMEDNESFDIEGRLNDSTDNSRVFHVKKKKKTAHGLDNEAFDQEANNLEENINSIADTLDQYQAEIENDMNEEKTKSLEVSDIMIGEVGNPHGQNEKLPDGTVKLKFKNVKFGKNAKYVDCMLGPKKPYKHLIKGDIILNFMETNLHEIEGYAAKEP